MKTATTSAARSNFATSRTGYRCTDCTAFVERRDSYAYLEDSPEPYWGREARYRCYSCYCRQVGRDCLGLTRQILVTVPLGMVLILSVGSPRDTDPIPYLLANAGWVAALTLLTVATALLCSFVYFWKARNHVR